MSDWKAAFRDHGIHAGLANLRKLLEEFDLDSLDESDSEAISRLHHATTYTRNRIDLTDPALTPTSVLDNVHTSLSDIATHVKNFKGDQNTNHLNNATKHLETVFTKLHQLVADEKSDEKLERG